MNGRFKNGWHVWGNCDNKDMSETYGALRTLFNPEKNNMLDFQAARKNMVDCQVHTSGVMFPALLEAYKAIPREEFIPAEKKNVAYNDEDIALCDGRYLIEPAVHARMIQALDLTTDHVVLDIGGATGYSAAILSSIVSTVVVLESNQDFIKHATQVWENLGLCNIAAFEGALAKGNDGHAPYDSIIINGAVASVPDEILGQLVPGGRLVCIVKRAGHIMGEATLFERSKAGDIASYPLFDAATPYLQGFEPQPEFRF